jgi:hypothetical protein
MAGALCAVALMVMTPPGFMVARTSGALPLVICTGHGPIVIADNNGASGHRAPVRTPGASDKACVFAGHAAARTLDTSPLLRSAVFSRNSDSAVAPADAAPGRGLAAPPPPSQAPPAFL